MGRLIGSCVYRIGELSHTITISITTTITTTTTTTIITIIITITTTTTTIAPGTGWHSLAEHTCACQHCAGAMLIFFVSFQ